MLTSRLTHWAVLHNPDADHAPNYFTSESLHVKGGLWLSGRILCQCCVLTASARRHLVQHLPPCMAQNKALDCVVMPLQDYCCRFFHLAAKSETHTRAVLQSCPTSFKCACGAYLNTAESMLTFSCPCIIELVSRRKCFLNRCA